MMNERTISSAMNIMADRETIDTIGELTSKRVQQPSHVSLQEMALLRSQDSTDSIGTYRLRELTKLKV